MQERTPESLREELARQKARLTELESECEQVLRKISELETEIRRIGEPADSLDSAATSKPTSAATKIALFRSLFRGRTDVYPTQWINSRKGTRGYSPACANEWNRGQCEKPRVKCGECPNRAFVPVTTQTISDHFHGKHVAGVYPLLEDETCWFLAVDFDKGTWREDVEAFVRTCRDKTVPVAVERSRSGNGAHVWFFFQSPVAATIARKMGCFLITETMAERHELAMTSYDRLFPNQDTMPRGGFGNLIALPFQHGPRQQGNTVFVDEAWKPYPNQWAFLASVKRVAPELIQRLARKASEEGRVLGLESNENDDDDSSAPWKRPPSRHTTRRIDPDQLPSMVRCILAQLLFVEKAGLPSALANEIKRLAAFPNPEFYKKQAMRLSTALTPRVVVCSEDHPQHIALPRGCIDALKGLLAQLGVTVIVDDQRTEGAEYRAEFHGQLNDIQERAAQAILPHDTGVFVAPPGSGKTVVGANLVARRGRNTLVLVHRTQLLEQWIAQLSTFLDLKRGQIGQIGAGKNKPNGMLDVAMMQSLVRNARVNDIVAEYGHVIVDECHHVPAVSFERVLREVRARYVLGLTATPRRRDGHHPILRLQLGPERITVDPRSQLAVKPFEHRLVVRQTAFTLPPGDGTNPKIQDVYRRLASDESRNTLILEDVIQTLHERRSPIVLTERRDHLHFFVERLRPLTRHMIVLQGGMKARERREAMERLATLPDTEERVVVATGRFIGEGFDDARLDTLFLALPVSWRGTLVQYAGRLHRCHHAKTEVRIMDYLDASVPMLVRMFEKRMRGYRAMGYVHTAPHDPEPPDSDRVIEYDDEANRTLDDYLA